MFSSYTSVPREEVFIGNFATSKVIGEGTIQFRSHDRCITTLQSIRYVLDSGYNLISLRALQGKRFSFNSEGDLMKVFKETRVKFQSERVGNVYILWNSKVTVNGLQLFSASKAMVVEQSETMMVSSSDVQLYPEERLGLGVQQWSPDFTPIAEQILINPMWIKKIVG